MDVFNLVYAASCVYALVRGGTPERIGALILSADFQLSHWVIAPFVSRYASVEWAMMSVDLSACLALYTMSLFTARYWPMWMTAIQGIVVLSHLAGARIDVIPWAYGNAVALWAYVLLALLAAATRRHRRRLARYGIDPAWRWQLPPAYRMGGPANERDAPRH
ncbi:hypothetical protein [Brevundimonas aurantiaca]|uniref:hypothetical protein n=1 Tax=Brevundimonas aurantiaca TaxID=74316 RepID=UPI001CD6206A|nr:hypothetical protein [Brevundimonas aurantiaca]